MGRLARQHFEERNFHNFAWFNRWLGKKLRDAPKPLALLAYDDADAARALGAGLADAGMHHLGLRKKASWVIAKAQSSGMRLSSWPSPHVSENRISFFLSL